MTAEENSTDGHGTIVALTEEQKEFLSACEAEFANRYTDNDPEFVQYKETPCTPPIIDPWYNKPRRNFDWAGRGNGGRRHQNWSRNDRGYNQGGPSRQNDRFYGNRHRPY
ncbi:hypothetical protein C0J52_11313 [Blattella germanica]|nr:hypothetical protein C0J52_11313 [Blattella germanica]